MGANEEERMKPKRLLIIGNGFDLHCGLKSTFENFISKKYGEEDTAENPLWEIDQINEKFKNTGGMAISYYNDNDIQAVIPHLGFENIWVEWLTLLRCYQKSIENWADVESQMTKLLTNSTVEKGLNEDDSIYHGDMRNEPDEVYRFLFLMKGVLGYKNPIEGLRCELTKFETSMMEYLRQQTYENKNYFEGVESLLSKLTKLGIDERNNTNNALPEPYNLLNFNYTNISNALQNGDIGLDSGLHPIAQRNIHGTTEEQAVIGIDSTNVPVNSPAVSFTKTYRLLEKQEIGYAGNVDVILSQQINTIVFYGHSLSNNDFAYFQSIFDFYHLYDSKIVLIFAYSIYNENKKMEIKENLYHNIQELLDRYGRSLGNDTHGRNLMHKLIIENRLFLKDV
ncbi:AbiH family protein [Lacticaseibacillus paracasei]|uniref:AbiH family protein n=1 Tax=Lacticaseibacillus paracasei TaxID=1597 RepID=UPI003CFA8FCB